MICNALWNDCGETTLLCRLPEGHPGRHVARVEWDDDADLLAWIEAARAGGPPSPKPLPQLGDDTCVSQNSEGYWCSLPKGHPGKKHVSQDRAVVYAAWTHR